MGERTPGGRTGRAWPPAVAVVLLGAAVLLSGLTRSPTTAPAAAPTSGTASSPASSSRPLATSSRSPVPVPSDVPRPPGTSTAASGGQRLTAVVLGLVALGLAAAVAAVLVRRRREAPIELLPATPPGELPDLTDAVDEAMELLTSAAEPRDGVIACWVRLEQAAAQSGLPRDPAATPTEFTAGLLVAGIAEEPAVRELLGLYHAARFGSRPTSDAAVQRAMTCLAAIRESALSRAPAR